MKKISLLAILVLLGGCFGGYTQQSTFYNLMIPDKEEVKPVSMKKLNVGVDTVLMPDYLDRPQMVVFEKQNPQMKVSETERWGEDLDDMTQRAIAADLSLYLPNSMVKSKVLLSEEFNWLVEVQVVRMDFIWGQKAVLQAWWSVVDSSGKIVKQQKFGKELPVGENFSEFVEAESTLLEMMSQDVAMALSKL